MRKGTEEMNVKYSLALKYIKQGMAIKEACLKANCPKHVFHYRHYGAGKNNAGEIKRITKSKPSLIPMEIKMSKVVVGDIPTQSLPSFIASLQ